jgi:FtsP/CotA-like multicopper oxidase with cupredoxin domain
MLPRRSLLAAAAATATATVTALAPPACAAGRKTLRLGTHVIDVGGKPATRYGVTQPTGARNLILDQGDMFDVRLENGLDVPSGLHWHGLNPPWRQDGVPYISAPPLPPGKTADYRFPAQPPGTRWMHSHFGLQEQNLLAAPLIVRETAAIARGLQEVVVLFEDFSWRSPSLIFEQLRQARPMAMAAAGQPPRMDLNDVTYDAFLANDRTLADPQVFDVDKGAEVRLRLINGAASTNFMIELAPLEGTVVTVDGNPVMPLAVRSFPLAVAQRVDIVLRVPTTGDAVAVLARAEGLAKQTGVFLRPPGARVARVAEVAASAAPALTLDDELKLRALEPLAERPVDRSVPVELTGEMVGYVWGMQAHGQGGAPVTVGKGERIELVMRNGTAMAHPMHLHGHSFQVSAINGQPLRGAMRDTVLVPPRATVKVAFDADNPGLWAYHCHNLYHLAAGMFTTVVYDGFS